MNVVHLPRLRQRNTPILCFVDLQREYASHGRALAVDEIEPWMSNCARLLSFAGEQRLPIAHLRQLRRGAFLNPATDFAAWMDEFRPRPSEMVFERSMPSCYSADGFSAVIDNIDDPVVVVAGLTSSGACLATLLDCFHRNHSGCFISDTSWSQPLGSASGEEANSFSTEIIRQYSDVMTTEELIQWLSKDRFSLVS